jgi:Flp pilus assembly pilin Flp
MFKHLNKRKGQSTLEYAVLIVIIIAALLAMNTYIKRGVQGRFKQAADDIGDQFSPGNTNYFKTTNTTVSRTRTEFGLTGIGASKSTTVNDEIVNVTSNGTILNMEFEFIAN